MSTSFDLLPADQKTKFDGIEAANEEKTGAVTVAHPRQRNRYHRVMEFTGPREKVLAHLKWRLQNDRITQCYEHMAMRITEMRDEGDGELYVRTFKSNYAGD